MNQTKIEWTDRTWNPIVGCNRLCKDPTGKIYCYAYYQAKRQKNRCPKCYNFEPHFHVERLLDSELNSKKSKKIFTCSMSEFWAPWVKETWQLQIMECIQQHPQHIFQILTKYPNYIQFFPYQFPSNVWCGTSISSGQDSERFDEISHSKAKIKFVSIEPFFKYFVEDWSEVDWVIFGLQTGRKPYHPPKDQIIALIQDILDYEVPLFIKNNVGIPQEHQLFRAEFPDGSLPNLKKINPVLKKPKIGEYL